MFETVKLSRVDYFSSNKQYKLSEVPSFCYSIWDYDQDPRVMAMHKYIHPRNIYRKPPDFAELAEMYPDFKAVTKLVGRTAC